MHKHSKEFHMVWNASGIGLPKVKHPTFDEASTEAKRLASTNPGIDFFVLTTSGHYRGIVKIEEQIFNIQAKVKTRKKKVKKNVS